MANILADSSLFTKAEPMLDPYSYPILYFTILVNQGTPAKLNSALVRSQGCPFFKIVNQFNKQGNRPHNIGPSVNLSPIRYHAAAKMRPLNIEHRALPLAKDSSQGVLRITESLTSQKKFTKYFTNSASSSQIPLKPGNNTAMSSNKPSQASIIAISDQQNAKSPIPMQMHLSQPILAKTSQSPQFDDKLEKTISSINVRLDGLQEKLRNYRDGNKMIMEEQEEVDTSNRARGMQDPLSSKRVKSGKGDETIVFEKLSRVSSFSKI